MFSYSDQYSWDQNPAIQYILVFSSSAMKLRFENKMDKRLKNVKVKDFIPYAKENFLQNNKTGAIYKLRVVKDIEGNFTPCIRCGFTNELLWEGQSLVTFEGAMFICKNQLMDLVNSNQEI